MDPVALCQSQARRIWLHAQKLDSPAPFGSGPAATPAAIQHLGYVQIDTIHVIERCHHHILFTRIPDYRREHLHQAQSVDKTIFEYWTHALAYLPMEDFRFYVRDMRTYWSRRSVWFTKVKDNDVRRILTRIRKNGALTIRDIDDEVLVEKDHAWASRKPSKRALQLAFYKGLVTVSQRAGMLKTYELTTRHFGWQRAPACGSLRDVSDYLVDRATSLTRHRQPRLHQLPESLRQAGDQPCHRAPGPRQGAGSGGVGRRGQVAALGTTRDSGATIRTSTTISSTSCRPLIRW